ncbi:MAG: hypothetical protein INR64_09555 [Caulobacteraceae bacterium]|nr:hypothetical protein [Caulobacter sp.]
MLHARSHRSVHMAAAAIACAGLCGCADVGRVLTFGGNDINVESPTAGAALAATKVHYVTPRFSEVPPKPLNAPSPGEIKRRVQVEVADRDKLDRWVAHHPQMTADPEDFAAGGQAAAAGGGAPVVTDNTAAAEAWADKVRASAAAPPPPQ